MPVILDFFSPQTKCHTLYNIQVHVPEKKMNIWTTQRHRQQYRTKTSKTKHTTPIRKQTQQTQIRHDPSYK